MKTRYRKPIFTAFVCLLLGLVISGAIAQPPVFDEIRFAVIGDYGKAGAGAESVANLVKSWQVDFIITTGDNNYNVGSAETIDENVGQYYHEFIFPYDGNYGEGAETNRFFPVLGNHDWQTDDAQPYLDYFTLPGNERYYDFTAGAVHFFMLDSDFNEPDGVSADSIQAEWLEEKLASATAPWKLVVLHSSPYSSGHHGSQVYMRWPYEDWGATAVISGHNHVYERLLVDGFPYFVNGAGGGGLYNFGTPIDGSQVRYNRNYGAMLVTASDESLTFEFYSVGDDTTPMDTYTISAP
jgi:tartrate-resistant acid phosphatase type 5